MYRLPIVPLPIILLLALLYPVSLCRAQEAAGPSEVAGNTFKNRLADETSPYLLQHATNPVDWWPWCDEAFAKAKREDKLVFLSVGYSSCHWCHVMEHESFEDEEVAAFLNEHFINIKVDREQRPDVDAIYMKALQLLTGRGGWPMSVFLTPDAKPFYGGSYFPARDGDRPGVPGFLSVGNAMVGAWDGQRDEVLDAAERVTEAIAQQASITKLFDPVELHASLVDRVQMRLEEDFDDQYAGFGFDPGAISSPKFPQSANLFFLLHRAKSSRLDEATRRRARQMFAATLDAMASGGIHDFVGGGFHRYSVDRAWTIPHFEKMLYDNGQLLSLYAEASILFDRDDYRWVVEDLVGWLERQMTSPEGAFYAAIDADSEGEEGKYYRWSHSQLTSLLTASQHDLLESLVSLDEPNFEDQFYVLQTQRPLIEIADNDRAAMKQKRRDWTMVRDRLLRQREMRRSPLVDTKILTAWNGLMICGLADAGRLLDEPRYLQRASRAASVVLAARGDDLRLPRERVNDGAGGEGYLDDYAMFVHGLIGLHRATGERRWLEAALRLTDQQIADFWDPQGSGFFFTSTRHEKLMTRLKDPVDSALPSGNSIAIANLVYLADVGERPDLQAKAMLACRAASGFLRRAPLSAPYLAMAVDRLLDQDKN